MAAPHARPAARFPIAVALSTLAHVLVLAHLPQLRAPTDPPSAPIEARLAAAPAPAPAVPAATPSARPRPRVPPPAAAPVATPESPVAALPRTPEPQPPAEQADAREAADPPAPVEVAGEAARTTVSEPSSAPPREAVEQAPPPPTRALPRRIAIRYDLFVGSDRFAVGETSLLVESAQGRYRLTSESRTSGLAGVFRPYQLAYSSEGSVSDAGLRPERFSARRGRGGEPRGEARFDWTERVLTLAGGPVPLAPGTHDLVSFMLQLALTELIPGRIRMPITNGQRLETYELDVGAPETIETPLGPLVATPIRRVRASGQESLELWLAPAYGHLPVRIRFLDRNGRQTGEQLVREVVTDAAP